MLRRLIWTDRAVSWGSERGEPPVRTSMNDQQQSLFEKPAPTPDLVFEERDGVVSIFSFTLGDVEVEALARGVVPDWLRQKCIAALEASYPWAEIDRDTGRPKDPDDFDRRMAEYAAAKRQTL